jgi:membrane-bound metal-dependent hydrolase YbcI (DUF457 family)
MFVGHLAVAFASKRASPTTSLGWFVAAGTTADLLWPVFLLVGIERVSIVPHAMAFNSLVFDSYPWSHSLLMLMVWGVLLAVFAHWCGVARTGAVFIAILVVSHWLLDYITHAPDMPLWPGSSPRLGLSLWNSTAGTLAIEGMLWVGGLAVYLRQRRPRGWPGVVLLWSLVVICTVMWAAGPWTPPPPSARSLAWFALAGWIIVPWAAWADHYYVPRSDAGSADYPAPAMVSQP